MNIEEIEESAAEQIAKDVKEACGMEALIYASIADHNAATQALLWRVVQNLTMEIADMRGEK